jgi:uncharacterized protein YndB with AHSA1/START domain
MLRILGYIAIALVVIVAGVLVAAAMQPDTFRVQRSVRIKAPPEKIYAILTDLRGWKAWSPYENKDPNMKRTYGAVTAGKGAVYEWDGDSNVGQGRMEIKDVAPPSRVTIDLRFIRPFEANNTAEFTLEPKGEATNMTTDVTWAIFGPMPFISKVICLFVNMDTMVGKDFEVGLASLKALAEK